MKLKIILTVIFSVLLTTAVFAQEVKDKNVKPEKPKTEKTKPEVVKVPNFSGNWTLDMKKTKFIADSLIKGITMKVLQTAKNLKIETQTDFFTITEKKSGERRSDGGFGKSPAQTNTVINYTLDGKETDFQETDGIGNAKRTAVIENNTQLNLTQTRRLNMVTGEKVLKTYEIWTLSADGKTLNVWRSTDKIKGDFMEKTVVAEITEFVFTKK